MIDFEMNDIYIYMCWKLNYTIGCDKNINSIIMLFSQPLCISFHIYRFCGMLLLILLKVIHSYGNIAKTLTHLFI